MLLCATKEGSPCFLDSLFSAERDSIVPMVTVAPEEYVLMNVLNRIFRSKRYN